jgi:hypothetical protein
VPRIRDVIDLAPIMGREAHVAMVKDTGVLVCHRCGEVMLDGRLLHAARANMAAMRCLRPSRLTPQLARRCRDLLGVTQAQLANRMGITRGTSWPTGNEGMSSDADDHFTEPRGRSTSAARGGKRTLKARHHPVPVFAGAQPGHNALATGARALQAGEFTEPMVRIELTTYGLRKPSTEALLSDPECAGVSASPSVSAPERAPVSASGAPAPAVTRRALADLLTGAQAGLAAGDLFACAVRAQAAAAIAMARHEVDLLEGRHGAAIAPREVSRMTTTTNPPPDGPGVVHDGLPGGEPMPALSAGKGG